jgi:5-methylcytosine-specific restriction endonuclease McrA
MQIIAEFIGERGLRLNYEKSAIYSLDKGFTFLSRQYQRKKGQLLVTPSDNSVKKIEHELNDLIMNYRGTQRTLIEKINKKLSGWASYHRSEDAYLIFRHVDAITEAILVRKMCAKHPRWSREATLRHFWIKEGTNYMFALPDDPSVRVLRLAPLATVKHKPCKLGFNPYLDDDYYAWLQGRRAMQKATGKYRAIWERQEGNCAYCGRPMLADEEIEVIEREIGHGRSVRNLLYIHRRCSYNIASGEGRLEHINAFDLLDGIMDEAPENESPYLELTEFFRLCDKTPVSLTFHQIEEILGDKLDWEAGVFAAFWYDEMPGRTSPIWKEEGYPFEAIKPSERRYCISDSWTSQGYKIKALHLTEQRVVFRREVNYQSGLTIPKAIVSQKLPDTAVREFNAFCKYFTRKYAL